MIFRHLLNILSHPTWVRGLKQRICQRLVKDVYVAPYVGAWIETYMRQRQLTYDQVAPYVGAWIETNLLQTSICMYVVAPYVGAWIETSSSNNFFT